MAVEEKRKCGFRKVGGMYFVGSGMSGDCHRLPMPIHVCPVCSNGLKYSMGFTWLDPGKFFGKCTHEDEPCHLRGCNVCSPPEGKHGLLWVGKKFYSAEEFTHEAIMQGVSKRISAVPRDFKLGETWIYLAHLEGGKIIEPLLEGGTMEQKIPAVFYAFKPARIEKIITQSQSEDKEFMEDLDKRNITPVIVPDNDKDHQGSVHDKQKEDE